MTPTPLLSRIEARRPKPQPITERMSPFMRRLAEKNLPVTDKTGYMLGSFVPSGSERGA